MPVLCSTTLIDAPPRTVAGLLRDSEVAAEALARDGHRFTAPARLLAPGDEVRLGTRMFPGVRLPVTTRITAISLSGMTSVLARGPVRDLVHTVTLTPTATGTRLLDELMWTAPWGSLGRIGDVLLLRRLVRRLLAARAEVLAERAAALAGASVVVATALVRDGRLLAAQRSYPPELAGQWELPGGRVEPGESEPDAVQRECREELGTEVRAVGRLGTDLPIAPGVLRVHRAEPAPGAAEPQPLEHSALRWVEARELAGLDWVAADRAVVADLIEMLTEQAPATE
ncbi:NUDIX domain-containing protein [Pseudonocardia sp. H11422]|uniref:NUDIX domain-containing protein n=1 Tax=Pseudonocardia sp. H11422 TaxID=2835866 RepID=UPI0027E2D780|nr:NUDIX domain-containing protein [Pseudonocardia sp. H11422]